MDCNDEGITCEAEPGTFPAIPEPVLEFPDPQIPAVTETVEPASIPTLADTGYVSGDLLFPGVLLLVAGLALTLFRHRTI